MRDDGQVRAALRVWRESLVDLGASGRLLDVRSGRGALVEIVSPAPEVVVRSLRLGGECRFRGTATAHPQDPSGKLTAAVLRRLHRSAGTEYLDRGVSVLHVAAGVLHWRDEDDAAYTSPALLIPVALDVPPTPGQLPVLRRRDDDPVVNPALLIRLRELGVDLAGIEPIAEDDLTAVWSRIEQEIAGRDGWHLGREALLSCFTFHKEALHRDLIDNEALIAGHPVVRALAVTDHRNRTDAFDFTPIAPADIDRLAPAAEVPLVLDADAAQRACVAAATAGHSFVLDGPPGTGKSQTIANMIACLLAAGKRVLFVSEKAAALDVVRTRLTGAGLDPYLLELHSHQAGRKEVAAALGSALERTAAPSAPAPPAAGPAADRQRLRDVESRLNAYAEAVNEVREPLGETLHDVLGVCAQLADVPDGPVPAVVPADLSAAALRRIDAAADRLARLWRAGRPGDLPWRHVVERAPLDALLSRARITLDRLAAAGRRNAAVALAFDTPVPARARELAALVEHAARRPPAVRDDWLSLPALGSVEEALAELGSRLGELRQARQAVRARAGVPWSALPAGTDLPDLPDELARLTAAGADDLARRCVEEAARWEHHRRNLDRITTRLGLPRVVTFADLCGVAGIVELGGRAHRPEPYWFGPGALATVSTGAAVLRRCLEGLAAAEVRARAWFTEAVLDLPLDQIAARVPRGPAWGRFSAAYRRDRRTVAAFVVPGADVRAAMARLDTAMAWQRARWELAAAEQSYAMVLGRYWRGLATDFVALDEAVRLAEAAIARTPPPLLPAVARHVCAADHDPESARLAAAARADVDRRSADRPDLRTSAIDDTAAELRARARMLTPAVSVVRAYDAAAGRELDFAEARRLAGLRQAVTDAEQALTAGAQKYTMLLGTDPVPAEADEQALATAIEWATAARRIRTGADRPLTAAQVSALSTAHPDEPLPALAAGWEQDRAAVLAAFAPVRHRELAGELADQERAAQLLGALRDDVTGQPEWFEYLAVRAELEECGLAAVVDFAAEHTVAAAAIGPMLRRAVRRAWAEHVLRTDPRLRPVRGTERSELVAQFRRLDRRRVGAAPAEVLAGAAARQPADRAGCLLIAREAMKVTGHLPVRELIARAGDAVLALKPCFLMSPLAVSQYLPPELRFDVVVFDEASQVVPADAIPSIYRADAFIAVGDERQLPPTSFFRPGPVAGDDPAATTDVDDFESVLELAKACGSFRQLSLRWHYRSRHESLIAFANHAFYQGRLVTFPSANGDGPDTGVAFFGVAGVYRRSAGRTNPLEAELVAERVVHHFATRPGRSVGVVTFSVAQAEEVQRAVDRAIGDAACDPFGDGARLHGLFVKSLESVQGDERDVMIFSVGYGYDESGRINANFGPLNRPHGRRRLNVAITRARQRIEIVSSIRAHDIPPSDNEGVRLLAAYLEYAERGGRVPPPAGGTAPMPSGPLVESIVDTIASWGHPVSRDVGTSAARVEIAVRHPAYPGEVYALGVRCDGPGYHASPAARDRDRLGDELLEQLGWRLHRVWSAAWYRDRAAEQARLRAAVERAVASAVGGRPPPSGVAAAADAVVAAVPAEVLPPYVTPLGAARRAE